MVFKSRVDAFKSLMILLTQFVDIHSWWKKSSTNIYIVKLLMSFLIELIDFLIENKNRL